MRNLSSLWATTTALPPTHHNHSITASTLDADDDVLYVVSEAVRDTDVHISVWRPGEDSILEPIASTIAPAIDSAPVQVVSATVLPDTRDLCIITRAGDITTMPLPPAPPVPSVVGTVSPGILAAALAPDASLLILVSAAHSPVLIIMHASDLTIVTEGPIHTSDPGAAQPVSAGWGSKATQFHGSIGKQAAQASMPARSTTSPDDDAAPRVAWRGDAQFFGVSAREGMRRVMRVYDRHGALQSTAEDVPGLEHTFAWRPSGALLVGTQRFGAVPGTQNGDWALGQGREGRHDVVFFERNGLRHGEFTLRELAGQHSAARPWGYRVRELAWNADSSVLSVWLERDTGDVVQLWTTGNYHWYLKLEIPAPARLTQVAWHGEDAARLVLATSQNVQDIRLTRYTASSTLAPPHDTGLIAVVDGGDVLLTPFRTQNVPPPMSAHRLALPSPSPPPVHIAFSSSGPSDFSALPTTETMAVLFSNGSIALWEIAIPLRKSAPRLVWQGEVSGKEARQCGVRGRADGTCLMAILCSGDDGQDSLNTIGVVSGVEKDRLTVKLPGAHGRLVEAAGNGSEEGGLWTWQANDGALWEVSQGVPQAISSFPDFCATATRVAMESSPTQFFGLCGATLYAASGHKGATPLCQACTSYTLAGAFLVWTATAPAHEAFFAPLTSLGEVERRRIERGARIVTVVPSAMGVVLQMPRGNLETIMPRALVLARVRQDILRGDYGTAFRAARKHRVDLNVLVEADLARFERSLGDVVAQLDGVEHLNLFLAGLGRSTQPPETIARLCDGIREELERRDVRRYVHAILTAHVVKTPPAYEAALALLLRLRDEDPLLVEDAVKYIIFLVDAERLFDTALGMYDFSLVLLVAQHSQKDPREYLPFLRSLRALKGAYQRFAIDNHLRRYTKALQSLHSAGAPHFDEAKGYVVRHGLYAEALALWTETEERGAMLELYGEYLFERREFAQAALAFVQAKRARKAMLAYEKSLEWQSLFDLAVREGIVGDELVTTARRVADDLDSKRRHAEAARVLLDYADDVDDAVAALVRGGEWSEARRIATLRKRSDLIDSVVMPGALDARSSLSEEIKEIDELRAKQVTRLDELEAKKTEEPDAFYGVEDANLANVDVMTDVSNPGTMFTRYTMAPSASSNRSKRTSRSKRKLDRKAGRKGTVEEEEYLLRSLTKLVVRLDVVLAEASVLLPQLLMLSVEHAEEARALQNEVVMLHGALQRDVGRIWDERSAHAQAHEPVSTPGGSLVEKVPRPALSDVQWRISWISDTGT